MRGRVLRYSGTKIEGAAVTVSDGRWNTVSSDDVKRVIRDSFEGAGLPAPFSKLLEIPLRQVGRALFGDSPSQWEQLIHASCAASRGELTATPIVAAAFELCIAALDVFDEIEDGDASPLVDSIGVPRAMNVATTLLAHSQVVLTRLSSVGHLANPATAFVEAMNRAVVLATIGQDEDLTSHDDADQSLERALQIARQKSGNLVAGAAMLGALTGSSDRKTLEKYREFGLHFGTMAQIANDIHDANPETGKSDSVEGKSTLPRLFAARSARSSVSEISDQQVERSGGLHFSWVVFEIERARCLKTLSELETAGQEIENLKTMVRA